MFKNTQNIDIVPQPMMDTTVLYVDDPVKKYKNEMQILI